MSEASVLQMKSRTNGVGCYEYLRALAVPAMSQPIISLEDFVPRLLPLVGIIFQVTQVLHVGKQFPVLSICETGSQRMLHLVRLKVQTYPLFQLFASGNSTPPFNFLNVSVISLYFIIFVMMNRKLVILCLAKKK